MKPWMIKLKSATDARLALSIFEKLHTNSCISSQNEELCYTNFRLRSR